MTLCAGHQTKFKEYKMKIIKTIIVKSSPNDIKITLLIKLKIITQSVSVAYSGQAVVSG
jgi:hypothetical protein